MPPKRVQANANFRYHILTSSDRVFLVAGSLSLFLPNPRESFFAKTSSHPRAHFKPRHNPWQPRNRGSATPSYSRYHTNNSQQRRKKRALDSWRRSFNYRRRKKATEINIKRRLEVVVPLPIKWGLFPQTAMSGLPSSPTAEFVCREKNFQ